LQIVLIEILRVCRSQDGEPGRTIAGELVKLQENVVADWNPAEVARGRRPAR